MSADAAGFGAWMRAHQVLAERALDRVLPDAGHAPARPHAHSGMRVGLGAGSTAAIMSNALSVKPKRGLLTYINGRHGLVPG